MIWMMVHPRMTPEALGFIPSFLSEDDPRPAREQMQANYGWRPFEGFTLNKDMSLSYDGDPDYQPLAIARLRKEFIVFYEHEFLMIMHSDNDFEIARVD
jgi:hypothetical protein